MSQSLVQNLLHVVFSTKYRQPLITIEVASELHDFLSAMCNKLKCRPYQVGGHLDHVHILCLISKNTNIADLVRDLKVSSSKWMKIRYPKSDFYWQGGYGAFSFHYERLDGLIKYIQNQQRHHASHSFQDEYRSLLRQHEVEFDERFMWD